MWVFTAAHVSECARDTCGSHPPETQQVVTGIICMMNAFRLLLVESRSRFGCSRQDVRIAPPILFLSYHRVGARHRDTSLSQLPPQGRRGNEGVRGFQLCWNRPWCPGFKCANRLQPAFRPHVHRCTARVMSHHVTHLACMLHIRNVLMFRLLESVYPFLYIYTTDSRAAAGVSFHPSVDKKLFFGRCFAIYSSKWYHISTPSYCQCLLVLNEFSLKKVPVCFEESGSIKFLTSMSYVGQQSTFHTSFFFF